MKNFYTALLFALTTLTLPASLIEEPSSVPDIGIKFSQGRLCEEMQEFLVLCREDQEKDKAVPITIPGRKVSLHKHTELSGAFQKRVESLASTFLSKAIEGAELLLPNTTIPRPSFDSSLPGAYTSPQQFAKVCEQGKLLIHRDSSSAPQKGTPMGYTFTLSYNLHCPQDKKQVCPGTAFFTQDKEPEYVGTLKGAPGVLILGLFNRYANHAPGYLELPDDFLASPSSYSLARSFVQGYATGPCSESVNWDLVGKIIQDDTVSNKSFQQINLEAGGIDAGIELCRHMDKFTIALRKRLSLKPDLVREIEKLFSS